MTLNISDKDINNESDLKLIEEYQISGDLEILGVLYEKYMHLIYGVCLKYFRDREESRDAVMSIFEKLITELEKHSVKNFKSWLYVLTKNYCLMHLRSGKSERLNRERLINESNSIMENAYELHPIDKESELGDRALEDCIKSLKEEQMKCVRLFYYDNLSYRMISEKLEMDEIKVKSHLQNAKRNLKICLESGNE